MLATLSCGTQSRTTTRLVISTSQHGLVKRELRVTSQLCSPTARLVERLKRNWIIQVNCPKVPICLGTKGLRPARDQQRRCLHSLSETGRIRQRPADGEQARLVYAGSHGPTDCFRR